MITFKCSGCGQKINAQDRFAGKKSQCPKCGQILLVPVPEKYKDPTSMIKFRCPSCNQKIGLTNNYAGKLVKCAKCKETFKVPLVSEEPTAKPACDESTILGVSESLDSMGQGDLANELQFQDPPTPAPVEDDRQSYKLADGPNEYSDQDLDVLSAGGGVRPTEFEPDRKKSSPVLAIVLVTVVFLISALIGYFVVAGAGEKVEDSRIVEAKELTEQFIYMTESNRFGQAKELLNYNLKRDTSSSDLEKVAKQLTRADIVDLTHDKTAIIEEPQKTEYFLSYFIDYPDDRHNAITSIEDNGGDLRISGFAISDGSGDSVVLGDRDYDYLCAAIAFADFGNEFKFVFNGFFCAIALVILVLAIIQIVSLWVIFEKVGQPGWAAIVPFYNMWVLAEVGDKPGWYGLMACLSGAIPFIGGIISLVFNVIINLGVAQTFGRGILFGIGLFLLPFIFYPILAFSND